MTTTATTTAIRSLQLTNPPMKGDDVRRAQQLLATGRYGNFHPGEADGEYGPLTAAAVKQAKWALGYADAHCDASFGPKLLALLEGAPLPADYAARREARSHTIAQHAGMRQKIVEAARWGIAHEAQIHYKQSRPIDGIHQPHKLPLHTDCSGFSTLCYAWAGAPDPNGSAFSGQGFTGTMLQSCRHIARSAVQPGDLVVWGAYPGHHVALVLEAGADPLLCSHGQEKGPLAIAFSVESKFQPSPATWLSILV
jgi:hypothetical protein